MSRSLTQMTLSPFQSLSPRPTGEASPSSDLFGGSKTFGSSPVAGMSRVFSDPSRNGASKGGLSHQPREEMEAIRFPI
ncbi:hypothetical protein JMM59_07460 [Rhodovulum sulfidophilum]|uniref:hypothetical protein n=1 Tax=Rhodovulum sulfidophilum TaxID=35806 RepID=UPI00192400A4|nr:hypothetical protein [Rhodovulum sulfidophilum]MBL3564843.1 hypothetical protein [Rhodovulum sulfidophilum]